MEKEKNSFSTFDAIRICGIDQSRFFHWLKDGYLPEGKLIKWGRGYKTEFSLYDLYSIALFKECVDFSLSRKVAKEYMNFAIDKGWIEIIKNEYRLMIIQYQKRFEKDKDGKDKFVIKIAPLFRKNREDLGRLYQSQIGFFIDLIRIMDRVNHKV